MNGGDLRSILHLDLDTFFVSVERKRNSQLVGKPLIIGGKNGRGVVASCSYETRRFGVHSAMPMRMALQLCPQAIVISGDMEAYSQHSRLITQVIADQAPLFEKSSIDEFYLDLTGMDRFFGCLHWAQELRKKIITHSGLPLSLGLSINKTVSKVATGEAKPNNEKHVPRGEEKRFLAPLSIQKIPMIGEKTYRMLRMRGIEKVATLSQMPPVYLQQLLGKNGMVIWKKANGIDDTPVVPYSEAKSISTEQTFQQDTIDVPRLKQILIGMTEKLAHTLRESQKLTSCVTVKIRYSNFDTETRQVHIPYTSCDHTLIGKVLNLFDQLYQRRMLLRLVGVRFSGLVQGNYQIDLFDDTPEQVNLYQAIDRIKRKFGADKLIRASGLGVYERRERISDVASMQG
ncbi:MAG: DNA polymerase IV [Candidatus Cyclobacteriaceae bacterium M3_2C_046]